MKKTIIFTATLVLLVLTTVFCGNKAQNHVSYAEDSYDLNLPTQQQIKDRFAQLNINFGEEIEYTLDYSTTFPYEMGDISSTNRQHALDILNLIRFIAGLPDDVALKDEYNGLTQAASLVNAVNDSLSHHPERPDGMTDELYEKGNQGASHSNIGYGYANIIRSIVGGYMSDSNKPSNISCVGHRRWILNPSMQYTGFGYVGRYTALYAFDCNRTEQFKGDYVAWPPNNMPMELYNSTNDEYYAFSVTLGDNYDMPSLEKVTVDITSQKQNKSWHLDKNSTDYSEYLTVENSYYGKPKCIIFNVGWFEEGDVVSVKINGIYKNDIEVPISYDVHFFAVYHHHNYTYDVSKEATCQQEGTVICTCSICGEQEVKKIPKIPHSYSSSISKAASCTENGIITFVCTYCNSHFTEEIPAKGHRYSSQWSIDKEPSCIAEGTKSHHCMVCGAKSNITSIPKSDHSFGNYVVKKQPTASETGIEERTCKVCGMTEQRTIAKLNPSDSSNDPSDKSGSPNTGKPGEATHMPTPEITPTQEPTSEPTSVQTAPPTPEATSTTEAVSTQKATSEPTEIPSAVPTEASPSDNGCGSLLGGGSVLLALISLAAFLFLKKNFNEPET